MHRAKHIADQIVADPQRAGNVCLQLTTSLAQDILNLNLAPRTPLIFAARIEVINLDRWVSQFLKRKSLIELFLVLEKMIALMKFGGFFRS